MFFILHRCDDKKLMKSRVCLGIVDVIAQASAYGVHLAANAGNDWNE
jgi:hypothetical protein